MLSVSAIYMCWQTHSYTAEVYNGTCFSSTLQTIFFLTKGAKVILNPESNIWRYQNIHDYLTHEPYTSGQPKGILKDQESH